MTSGKKIETWVAKPSLLYCISRKTVDTEYTSTDIVTWGKTNDYENFEKRGVVEKRGEEETKSMPHATVSNLSKCTKLKRESVWHFIWTWKRKIVLKLDGKKFDRVWTIQSMSCFCSVRILTVKVCCTFILFSFSFSFYFQGR
jgi:hypothetical protein